MSENKKNSKTLNIVLTVLITAMLLGALILAAAKDLSSHNMSDYPDASSWKNLLLKPNWTYCGIFIGFCVVAFVLSVVKLVLISRFQKHDTGMQKATYAFEIITTVISGLACASIAYLGKLTSLSMALDWIKGDLRSIVPLVCSSIGFATSILPCVVAFK